MALNAINLSAAGNAISEGLDSYLKAKQMRQQNDLAQNQQQMAMAQSGLIKDPETGLIQPSPLAQMQKQEQMQEYSNQGPLHDSLLSAAVRQSKMVDKNSIGPAPELTNKQIKEYMAATKPELSGQYGLLGKQGFGAAQQEKADTMKDNQTAKAVDDVVKDPAMNQHIQRINGANRIQSQVNAAKAGKFVDTSQLLGDINAEYTNLVTGSNSPALGKQERTEYTSAAAGLSSLLQKISGDPKSINSPEIMNQLSAQVDDLKGNYQNALKIRANSLKRNYPHNKDATQQQQDKIKEMIETYGEGSPQMEQSKGLVNPQGPVGTTQGMSRADKEAMARKLMGQ